MAKKTKADELDAAAPVVEVAPECQHRILNEMRQDDETRVFVVRDLCPKCGWSSAWIPQREAILRPIERPVVQQF